MIGGDRRHQGKRLTALYWSTSIFYKNKNIHGQFWEFGALYISHSVGHSDECDPALNQWGGYFDPCSSLPQIIHDKSKEIEWLALDHDREWWGGIGTEVSLAHKLVLVSSSAPEEARMHACFLVSSRVRVRQSENTVKRSFSLSRNSWTDVSPLQGDLEWIHKL